jgi:hypothetical protein
LLWKRKSFLLFSQSFFLSEHLQGVVAEKKIKEIDFPIDVENIKKN